MSRVAATFAQRKGQGRPALISYLTVGYPDTEATLELVPALVAGGADLVELGIPFSDPLADGATIQRASFRALQQGVTPSRCLEVAARLRQRLDVPLLFMSYYNPILRFGPRRFAAACADAGVDGLIVPDLPPEEAGELREATRAHGLDLVFLLAPTSTDQRIARVAEAASGFIYCVSLTGVTGARDQLSSGLADFIGRVRRHTSLPLAVGFGISRPEHVAAVGRIADGVVVGSALLDRLETLPRSQQATGLRDYIAALRRAAG